MRKYLRQKLASGAMIHFLSLWLHLSRGILRRAFILE